MADTPNIRIEGFEDDWVEKQLGDLYIERNERGNDSLQILSVSIHSGVSDGELDEDGLGKVVRRSEDKSTYKHVYPGDLIFNMMRAWQGAIGVAKIEGMISPAYISAVPNDEVYPPFMDYLLRRKEVIDQINNLSYGVTDFRKRLYWDSFVKVKCFFPSVEEQKKIVHVLEELDKNISHQEKEVVGLKKLKQYLLQKMFPRDGERVPEIRFEGYSDDWEERKYSEVINLLSGQDFEPSAYNDEGHGIPYMTGASCVENGKTIVSRWTETPKCVANRGDVLLVCKGSGCGTIAVLSQEKAHIARQFMALKCTKELDANYNYYLANSVVSDITKDARGLIAGIARDAVLNQGIMLPKILEQQVIGDYFRHIDNLITLHQRKLDTLKTFKTYLLQNMFLKED